MKPFNKYTALKEIVSDLSMKKEILKWLKQNIRKYKTAKDAITAVGDEFGIEDEVENRNHWIWKLFKK
jgi:hypothetical protein|tara:strand:+ start:170 stop:373 length:204 start_codon:yes stop_codon:yes gene_type:complete